MMGGVVADLQQQGDGELAHGGCAVGGDIGQGDALLPRVRRIHHVVAGGQHGDVPQLGTCVDDASGDGGLVGHGDLRPGQTDDGLLLVRQGGAVIYGDLAECFQRRPAQVAGIFGISV